MKILIPFLIASLVAFGIRFAQTDRAVQEIAAVAHRLTERLSVENPSDLQTITDDLANDLYGASGDAQIRANYKLLVRTIAYRIQSAPGFSNVGKAGLNDLTRGQFVEAFSNDARDVLRVNLYMLIVLTLPLILLFPAFFIIAVSQAARQLRSKKNQQFSSFTEYVQFERNQNTIDTQSPLYFWRRFGFGLFISIGVAYIFAPIGMKASILGEYVALAAPPAARSFPFWAEHFAEAPPLVVGFLGYYLYSLTVFSRRFYSRDLSVKLLISLFNRGILVVLLSLVLSSITEGEGVSRATIFVAGIFPQTGLRVLGKLTLTRVEGLLSDGKAGFAGVPELDVWKQTSLEENGIFNRSDLAKKNLHELIQSVGINARTLVRAADKAILIDALGQENAQKLGAVPIDTASELVLYLRGTAAFAARWKAGSIPHCYRTFSELAEAEMKDRQTLIQQVMNVKDIDAKIDELQADYNVIFIINNKIWYADV